MSAEPKYRDEAWLREQYIRREQTCKEIAEDCGCSTTTVHRWLKNHDIQRRGRGGYGKDQRYRDKKWLRQQYVEEVKTCVEIANDCGCTGYTILNWLNKHGIETRDPVPRERITRKRAADSRLTDREWLRQKYKEERMSATEIALQCGCSADAVLNWLDKHDIETYGQGNRAADDRLRSFEWLHQQYVNKDKSCTDIARECGCSISAVSDWLKKHGLAVKAPGEYQIKDDRLNDPEWLRNQYVEKEKACSKIAEECGCTASSVSSWLIKHDIETRDGGLVGPNNPNWEGGSAPYGPGWNNLKKRAVRERDDYSCQDPRCSVTQTGHLDEYGEKLHVHHLRKARDVDDPEKRNAKENLITLCRDCHRRWEKIADTGLVPQVSQ